MPLSYPRCQHYVCNECHESAEAEANLLSEQLLCDELYRDTEEKILARAKAWVDGVWTW